MAKKKINNRIIKQSSKSDQSKPFIRTGFNYGHTGYQTSQKPIIDAGFNFGHPGFQTSLNAQKKKRKR